MHPASRIHVAIVISAALIAVSLYSQPCSSAFRPIQQGLLCIRSPFVQTIPSISSDNGTSEIQCSYLCSNTQNSQAFSTADGPCQLFVFDRCSKSVRDCSCSRRGRVFVKQQPGLQAGRLCPPEYGNDLCGVKYRKISPPSFWAPGRQKCAFESGLTIMADVVDTTEMDHVKMFFGSSNLWLGGFLLPASGSSPAGWYWVDCNISVPVSSSLWSPGQPNNSGGSQDAISMQGTTGLDDRAQNSNYNVLCECLDPFN